MAGEDHSSMADEPSDGGPALPPIAPKDLRDVLGSFATGVTVITSRTREGERLGTTASSFNSVSLDPPLVLFSLARNAKSFDAWQRVDGYAVNVLSEHQDGLSTRFARAMTDKWEGIVPVDGPALGLPLLPGALATLECATHARYDGGDHVIMVGRVVSLRGQPPNLGPLVFFGSRYRRLDAADRIATPADADIWLHGW